MYNVIGDVAGNFLTLKALIEKMPKDSTIICLGDPNDRGPRSKQVIEYLMDNKILINSNHAHMLVEEFIPTGYYEKDLWVNWNGGDRTLESYETDWKTNRIKYYPHGYGYDLTGIIPQSHIDFLKNSPLYMLTDDYLFSHAPINQNDTIEEASDIGLGFENGDIHKSDKSFLWNRYIPDKPNTNLNGKINVFGHMASDHVKVYNSQYRQGIKVCDNEQMDSLKNSDIFGICLDTSSRKVLTGMHFPSMMIYEQEWID